MDKAMVSLGGVFFCGGGWGGWGGILLYMWVLILAILFYKITLLPP